MARKGWSKIIEEHGVKIRLFERSGSIYRDVTLGRTVSSNGKPRTEHDIKSLEHSDRKLAERQAKALAKTIAERRLTGHTGALTFGQLRTQYLQHRGPLLSKNRKRTIETMLGLFARHLGDAFPMADFDQHRADTYVAARVSGKLRPDDFRAREKPQAGTVRNELHVLNTVCNWATRYRVNGRPLLTFNPVRGLNVPVEENPRRPVATPERYAKLAAVANEVDPSGYFGLMLAIAWHTGRRINAILHLTASDVLMTQAALNAAFAESGQDDSIARDWGAGIRWRAKWDKKGYLTFSPMPSALREPLTAFVRRYGVIGEGWLFATESGEPTKKARAEYLLRKAEDTAGLAHQTRGGWHALRRGWATLRKSYPVQDVMAAGGWRDPQALQTAYQAADSKSVRAVVDIAV